MTVDAMASGAHLVRCIVGTGAVRDPVLLSKLTCSRVREALVQTRRPLWQTNLPLHQCVLNYLT